MADNENKFNKGGRALKFQAARVDLVAELSRRLGDGFDFRAGLPTDMDER